MSTHQEIWVYPLSEPACYLDNLELLATTLLPDVKENADKKFFLVSASGFITYNDYNELWQENAVHKRKLPDKDKATRTAMDFITQVQEWFADKNNPGNEKLVVSPFPSCIHAVEAVAVLHPKEQTLDHWLCRFETSLYRNDEERIPVHGAHFEIRIGNNNKIIGLNIRWRPMTGNGFKTTLLPPGDARQEGKEMYEKSTLVYLLEDDNQKFLAPYYISGQGINARLAPASEYSIVTDIFQRNNGNGAHLYAMVNGGNPYKKFSFNWKMFQPGKLLDEGMKFLGTSSIQKNIPLGVHYISLDVNDAINGQTKRLRKKIYVFSETDIQRGG